MSIRITYESRRRVLLFPWSFQNPAAFLPKIDCSLSRCLKKKQNKAKEESWRDDKKKKEEKRRKKTKKDRERN